MIIVTQRTNLPVRTAVFLEVTLYKPECRALRRYVRLRLDSGRTSRLLIREASLVKGTFYPLEALGETPNRGRVVR